MKKKIATKEEKIANGMIQAVNDFTLDLDHVGRYIAEQSPAVLYNRLIVVVDSMEYEKEKQNGNNLPE